MGATVATLFVSLLALNFAVGAVSAQTVDGGRGALPLRVPAGIDPIEVARINLLHMTDPDGISVQMADTNNTIDCPNGIGMPPCEPVPGQEPR